MRGVPSLGETDLRKSKNEPTWQNRGGSIAPEKCGIRLRGVLVVKIVVGLGNPGREYAATRHNLGFMVVDELARRHVASERRNRFRSDLIEVFDQGEKIVLIKPRTYMNLSGSAVREAVNWYKTPLNDVLVVVDDIDLPFGSLRLRARGGSGGHNGLKSIIAELGMDTFPRMRVGIGRGPGHATRQVLSRFTSDEERVLPSVLEVAADCVEEWERHGIIDAMNRCNRTPDSENGSAPPIEER
jgi:PTH1 family peptidyl-tRNA hydrolase